MLDTGWLTNDRLDGVQGLSNRVASWFDWTTSNQITLARLILVIPLSSLLTQGYLVLGTLVGTVSFVMDFLDGALARYHQDRAAREITPEEEQFMGIIERLNIRGKSQLGKTLDPLADKATYLGALVPLGIDHLHWSLMAASITLAVVLTVVRPIKRWFGLGDGAANRFGKWKLWCEIAVLVALVFVPVSFGKAIVATLLVILAILLAALSLFGQMYTARPSTSPAP